MTFLESAGKFLKAEMESPRKQQGEIPRDHLEGQKAVRKFLENLRKIPRRHWGDPQEAMGTVLGIWITVTQCENAKAQEKCLESIMRTLRKYT